MLVGQRTFASTMGDDEVVIAAEHNYGNVAGCGIRGELVQEYHRSG